MKRREFLTTTGVALGTTILPASQTPESAAAATQIPPLKRRVIKIVGLGGSGGNVIDRLGLDGPTWGAELVAINTNLEALTRSSAHTKVQIGRNLTRGLGAGARPDIGRRAALENIDDIQVALAGADVVLLHCGLGGGCGTGAAPLVAAAARDAGATCVAIATMPFVFEGRKRWRQAELGLADLAGRTDSLIVIPLEALRENNDPLMDFKTALSKADLQVTNVITQLNRSLTLPVSSPADILVPIIGPGVVRVGTGSGSGPNAIEAAADEAVTSPFLAGASLLDAAGVMVDFRVPPEYGGDYLLAGTGVIVRQLRADCRYASTSVYGDDASVTILARIEGPWGRDFTMPTEPVGGSRFRRAS